MVTIKINKTKTEVQAAWEAWKKENWGLYKSLMQICALCGSDDKLQIHHKNYNRSDSRLPNLICLCKDCHLRLHAKSDKAIRYLDDEIELPEQSLKHEVKALELTDLEWRNKGWYNKRLKTYLT